MVRSGDRFGTTGVFKFMRANQAIHAITTMCRVLEVSTSGYYEWYNRGLSNRAREDVVLTEIISEIHAMSNGVYGVPNIHAELADRGWRVGRKRVARLMKAVGLQGVTRRKTTWTTRRSVDYRPAPDLVDRDFTADGPNKLWVADITYIPTWEGFLYLAVVIDVWSRRCVGWAMANHPRTELVVNALHMAIQQRRPTNVIHHSDQGCQYTSIAFGKRCWDFSVQLSMGSVGDCYDNALCESFFASLECELIDRTTFHNRREARNA
ncbi:MAG: IS3 family transposase, partial [bacterium]|nr:IS3 family transposase [bacterium]